MDEHFLQLNGLSLPILDSLSYESRLGISLKKNLHYFEKDALIQELIAMTEWLDTQTALDDIALDYRIKSVDSIVSKYDRYFPDHQVRKVFNDILGFRAFCDQYDDLLLIDAPQFHVENVSLGKTVDDGYRGVHIYYQRSSSFYPIEIQYNTLYDRQLNNWLHDYLYKKNYPSSLGKEMRKMYEMGCIKSEKDFEEVLNSVLSGSKR
ncbi:MAG: hypothetical protein LKJ90_08475 [Faecalibacterium sp.]|jgi:ppGpp synthetase/RelA/SpoT-type nucleotidyltranferase|nr:hypothetical protein [Faecalibacterium sp.]